MSVVYYLFGVPASGKSTIVQKVMSAAMPSAVEFRCGKLRGYRDGGRYVLGVYEGMFGGTDRLPNDVINDAIKFIRGTNGVFLVEGDRLACARFFAETSARLIAIDAAPEVLQVRHAERGDSQSAQFLQRCRTKTENLIRKYGLRRFYNNTPADAERLIAWLTKEITKR